MTRHQNVNRKPGCSKRPKSHLRCWLRDFLNVLFAVLLIQSFVLASFEVPTGSMEDTVAAGDRLFVNKFVYGGTTPYTFPFTSIRIPHLRLPGIRDVARGDVIIFDWPGERDQVEPPRQTWYLKRCIGLPGDVIQIRNRHVFVNGEQSAAPIHVRHLRDATLPPGEANPMIFPRESGFNEDHYGPVVVPRKGMKIYLDADTIVAWDVLIRREGHDVRLQPDGLQIDGRKAGFYAVEQDYLFVMGDNRDISIDSRFWGFVPSENVIGTPLIVYWSWNPDMPLYQIIDKLQSVRPGRIGTLIR